MPNQILKKLSRALFTMILMSYTLQEAQANVGDFAVIRRFSDYEAQLPENGLRIFWWNIGCGLETGTVRKKSNLQSTVLEKNLLQLINSPYRPEVIILGEYCPQNMPQKDKEFLIQSYRNNFHLQRNIPKNSSFDRGGASGNGFLILSDFKIDVLQNSILNSKESKESHKDDRKYLLFKIAKAGVEYLVNPVHLANPWRILYNELGPFGVFKELRSGQNNSNAVQIRNIIKNFVNYVDRQEKFICIGDFNSPGSLYGFSGYAFSMMNTNMDRLKDGYEETFLGEGQFPASDIDHAFGVNINSLYSKVWPLEGSRHLPIYLVIN